MTAGMAIYDTIAAEHIKETKYMLNRILSENCEKIYEQVAEDTERDHWMRANEAVAYGIVDAVMKK